jgi:hypothetical protein
MRIEGEKKRYYLWWTASDKILSIVCTLGRRGLRPGSNAAHCSEIEDGQSRRCDTTAALMQEATHAWNLAEEGQMPYAARRA